MAVVIGGLVPRATTYDLSGYQLETAYGVHALTIGARSFVYATGLYDDGMSAFELGANGSLTNIQNVDDGTKGGALTMKGATAIASATVGGSTYLYVAASLNHKPGYINVFEVGADGRLSFVDVFADTAATQLSGIEGRMAVATVGTSTYLVATGDDDNGASVFRINADGTLTNTHNVHDNATMFLDNAMDAVAAQVGDKTFVFVAGEDDNGLSAFELRADGTLVNTDNVGDNATMELWGAMGLATAVVDGVTYLIASGGYDDGLSVFSVSGAGQLANVFNLGDTAARGLDGAQGLTTFTLGGETFLAVSGRDDDALSLFLVGAGGVLTDVTAVFDDAALALDSSFYNAFAVVGGTPLLVASGYNDNGLSTFEVVPPGGTGPNQPPTDITVEGGTVKENAAAGTVVAKLGAVDPDPGETFTFAINDPSGLFEIVGNEIRVAAGAVIDYEAAPSRTVTLTVTDSAGASHGEDLVIGILDVDESTPSVIIGTSSSNTLTGASGPDEIWGRGGNDTLLGLEGNDKLYGEAGADLLDGGAGADTMTGGAGNDTYVVDDFGDTVTELSSEGQDTVRTSLSSYSLEAITNVEHLTFAGTGSFTGTGNTLANTLTGGNGDDTLRGGSGKDILKGAAGNDTLEGGAAADTLEGGEGADVFLFSAPSDSPAGTGQDRINDFLSGVDRIVVTAIDANIATSGNQAFVLDTDGSFSTGEIRQTVSGGNLLLEFNTDKDTSSEMTILLGGVTSPLSAGDFEL